MHSIFFVPPRGVPAASSTRPPATRQTSTLRAVECGDRCGAPVRSHWRRAAFPSCCRDAEASCPTRRAVSLVASANSLSFGSVSLGQTSGASVSLRNESTAAVQISQVSLTGPFSVMGQSGMPVTIASGGTYAVSLQFTPTSVGAATGSLTLTTNSTSGNPVVSLSGTGTADAQASAPGAMISPAPGSVLPGSSVTFTWSAGSGVAEYSCGWDRRARARRIWVLIQRAWLRGIRFRRRQPDCRPAERPCMCGCSRRSGKLAVHGLHVYGSQHGRHAGDNGERSLVHECDDHRRGDGHLHGDARRAGQQRWRVSEPGEQRLRFDGTSSVLVGANRSSATFTAIAAAVSATQTATITASVGTSSATFALQLSPQAASSGTAALSLSASSLSFAMSRSTPRRRPSP